MGHILRQKSFVKMTPGCQFQKSFLGCNLHLLWCIVLSFDSGYAARGINYGKKVLKD
jgi:hypothetical protein